MYTNDRMAYRQVFFQVWQQYQNKKVLEQMEAQLLDVILLHPEYHSILQNQDLVHQEFAIEENPFFHMSSHLVIRDQLKTNRPLGIGNIYQALLKFQDKHQAEHVMMKAMSQVMQKAHQTGNMPDEREYVALLNGSLPSQG